jgi:hypothetical protein
MIVPGFRFRRARTLIKRLYPQPPHQRPHVTAIDLAPLGSQKASKHPCSRKGELQLPSKKTVPSRPLPSREALYRRPWPAWSRNRSASRTN